MPTIQFSLTSGDWLLVIFIAAEIILLAMVLVALTMLHHHYDAAYAEVDEWLTDLEVAVKQLRFDIDDLYADVVAEDFKKNKEE